MTSASHHDTLGLRDDAPPREIRLAYLRAALEAHPDHGGSHAKMVAVCDTTSLNDHSRLTDNRLTKHGRRFVRP